MVMDQISIRIDHRLTISGYCGYGMLRWDVPHVMKKMVSSGVGTFDHHLFFLFFIFGNSIFRQVTRKIGNFFI